MPPFWVGFSKQRKKPGSWNLSNCVQNAFFQLSPSGRNKKTPLGSNFTISISWHHFGKASPSGGKSRVYKGRPIAFKTRFFNFPHRGETKKTPLWSNFTISVSCHHFGWAFPSSGKSRVHEGRQIAFKTRFFNFPHRGETKKRTWDRILQFRFQTIVLVGLSKQRKKPGWRRSSNCFQNAFFQLSPSGRNKKTPLGSNFTISVSCHHFGWAFPSSGKSRVDEGRPIPFKTRFFNFPHRGETKKHPWDRILQFRFHFTILGGLFQAAEKAGWTKVDQFRSKRVFSTFPIGAKRKNTLWIEYYNFGFMPPFWVGFSKQRKKPGGRRSTNYVQNAFFQLSPSGRNEKTPLESNFTISVSCHHFGNWSTFVHPVFSAAWKSPAKMVARTEIVPIPFKTRFFNFRPSMGKRWKNTLGIEFYEFQFHATILGGLLGKAQRKKPALKPKLSSNCDPKTRFFNFRPSMGESWKNTLGIEFYDLRSCPAFSAAWKSPAQNGDMKPKL